MHAAYAAKAKELHSSLNAVAIADWMKSPEVTAIDPSQYNKHVGDAILIAAPDDFAVKGVMVAIVDNAQNPVEAGAAVLDAASGSWKYTTTVDASAKPGVTVTATASDRPGNTGTLSGNKSRWVRRTEKRETRARSTRRAVLGAAAAGLAGRIHVKGTMLTARLPWRYSQKSHLTLYLTEAYNNAR